MWRGWRSRGGRGRDVDCTPCCCQPPRLLRACPFSVSVFRQNKCGPTEEVKEGFPSSLFPPALFSLSYLITEWEHKSCRVSSEGWTFSSLMFCFCVITGHVHQFVKATVLHSTLRACYSRGNLSLLRRWAPLLLTLSLFWQLPWCRDL